MTKRDSEKELYRIEAFSDGVFAIAITLLVLDIKVPPSTHIKGTLLKELINMWPSFLAMLVGFLTILVCWINHHHICKYIVRSNHVIEILNAFILLAVIMVPFSTSLLAEYLNKTDEPTVLMIFGITFCLISLLYNVLWWYSLRRGLTDSKAERKFLVATQRIYAVGMCLVFVIFGISLLNVIVAMLLYSVIFAVYSFPGYFAGLLQKRI